jgi:hypothetical protein
MHVSFFFLSKYLQDSVLMALKGEPLSDGTILPYFLRRKVIRIEGESPKEGIQLG